jgi:hypothetical protein
MTKLAPYYLEVFCDWFRLTRTSALGLGAYANSQGGEHKNKFAKAAARTWVSGRKGCFTDLLDQMCEMFIAAPSLFPQIIPDIEEIGSEMRTVWEKLFGKKDASCCCCCGDNYGVDNLQSLLFMLYAIQNNERFFYTNIIVWTKNKTFEDSSLTYEFLFQKYLRLNLWEPVCKVCAEVFMVLVAMLENCEEEFNWLEMDYVFKKGGVLDQSDDSEAHSSDED